MKLHIARIVLESGWRVCVLLLLAMIAREEHLANKKIAGLNEIPDVTDIEHKLDKLINAIEELSVEIVK